MWRTYNANTVTVGHLKVDGTSRGSRLVHFVYTHARTHRACAQHTHTYCDTPRHSHTHARTHARTHACMHTRTDMHAHCTHAHTHTHARTYTCTCAHTHKKKKKTTTTTPIHVTIPNTIAIRPAPSVFTRSMNIRPPEQQNPKTSPPDSSLHPATNSIPSHAAWKILPSPVNTKHAHKNPEPQTSRWSRLTVTSRQLHCVWELHYCGNYLVFSYDVVHYYYQCYGNY